MRYSGEQSWKGIEPVSWAEIAAGNNCFIHPEVQWPHISDVWEHSGVAVAKSMSAWAPATAFMADRIGSFILRSVRDGPGYEIPAPGGRSA